VVLKSLTDAPAKAKWLKPEERDWLVKEMAAETGPSQRHSLKEVLGTLISWKVMQLALVYFGLTTGLYGIELWMPQMLKGFGLSDLQVGFVSAIPYLADFLTGQKAAAGIAAINSVGNLGGFLGPFLIGWARQATGNFIAGLMISAVTLLASAMIVISLRRSAKLSILQPTTQH